MDHHASDILRCKWQSGRPHAPREFDAIIQVALFLIFMPVVAAPLQGLAVLGAQRLHEASLL